MCVCVCVCVCVCMYICMYVCMCVYVDVGVVVEAPECIDLCFLLREESPSSIYSTRGRKSF